jgi:hypothetical protein
LFLRLLEVAIIILLEFIYLSAPVIFSSW